MQIMFIRWCLDPQGRTPVSVDPARVDITEHWASPMAHSVTGEKFPSATKIIMRNKQEYIVQGPLSDVVAQLNAGKEKRS